MNRDPKNTAFAAEDFISENAVRNALERQARSLPASTADGGDGLSTELRTAAGDPSPRASRPRRLRRWSVAELIAGAVARPPTGGVAH